MCNVLYLLLCWGQDHGQQEAQHDKAQAPNGESVIKTQPALVPEDLGIDLDEDSSDFTEEEAKSAAETSSTDDFVMGAAAFIKQAGSGEPHYERRVRAGIFYCRILVAGQKRVFRTDWLRRRNT